MSRPLMLLFLGALLAIAALASGCSLDGRTRSSVTEDDLSVERIVEATSTEISLFYPSADTVVEEKVTLSDPARPELQAMRMLFQRDPSDPSVKVTLPDAKVRDVRMEDGLATVDFSRDVLVDDASERMQRVALVSIMYTLRQFAEVKQVAFTVEGKTSGELGGKDVRRFWGEVTLDQAPWSVSAVAREEGSER